MFMHRGEGVEGVGRVEDLLEDSANRACMEALRKYLSYT